ncbi:MAG: hypothetical protein HOG03_08765 [Desulfobacula sp.]|jgi:hypothetical protein|uniref:hypothetical protein n=1 Tax=Desulfobacula sp. TaxID=2593537 RepID=UPI001D714449|nr:hypothetical protein [Desulfobacula sp.]MBT3484850.1 hypothetical protein [Desulfobacula sp.]MBT3804680.1 hypothetical protein [Desulfobacula sp.]MBT4024030.1 hypothetical protein [Desulfobacula sp.]MBT4198392.1 hypothetical protein [Desulfobacula sp.]
MNDSFKNLDYSKFKTYSCKERVSKVNCKDFSRPWEKGGSFSIFLDKLPSILAGNDIRYIIKAISCAAKKKKQVCFAMGGHIIKTGMSPIIIDLMKKNVFTLIAMNGAGIIHDLETAMMGRTSEDVALSIGNGSFGMAKETSAFLNQAIKNAKTQSIGLGRAVGHMILKENLEFKNLSLTASGAALDIPVTVHVAIGTDIIHMHPDFDAGACGEASHYDFKWFSSNISNLENGVFINAGSAVIMPEVFLKAVSLARNLGHRLDDFTTVNLDFIRHYRPMTNVVNRPTLGKGKGFNIVGHHEILIPLIAAGVVESL